MQEGSIEGRPHFEGQMCRVSSCAERLMSVTTRVGFKAQSMKTLLSKVLSYQYIVAIQNNYA